MANLFGFLAAGAAEGIGKGMSEDADAKRVEALEAMRAMREDKRLESQQTFTAGQGQLDRDFRSSESAADRAARSSESALDRAAAARNAAAGRAPRGKYSSTFIADDGRLMGLTYDGQAEPIMSADGKPIKPKDDAADARSTYVSTFTNDKNELMGLKRDGSTVALKDENGAPIKAKDPAAEARPEYISTFTNDKNELVGLKKDGSTDVLKDANGAPVRQSPKTPGGRNDPRWGEIYKRIMTPDMLGKAPMSAQDAASAADGEYWQLFGQMSPGGGGFSAAAGGQSGTPPPAAAPAAGQGAGPAGAAVKGDTPPSNAPQKPVEYPQAIWSTKHGAWLIPSPKNPGKWLPLIPAETSKGDAG